MEYFQYVKNVKKRVCPKKGFSVCLCYKLFPAGITFGHVSPSFCAKVFFTVFLLKYTFFAVQEALHTQKTTCAFYARQKRRQELSFSKVADFVEIREKQKTKNQLSKRSSDKYSLLHTGF